jgi:Fe-S-cluster containining protein
MAICPINCAVCCKTMLVKMTSDDTLTPKRLNFQREFKFADERYAVMDSVCKYLHGSRCSIYDRRPQRCKDFPVGEEELWATAFPDCVLCSK